MRPYITADSSYLLLARCEEHILALVEENIKEHYDYEKLSAKTFWLAGERAPKEVLTKILSGIGERGKIYLYSLNHPQTAEDLDS